MHGKKDNGLKWKAPALRLIDAAEELFGEHGIEGVSLVQIAQKAGQANKYAVQYHFGSKENLIRAIFETRLKRIGERRRRLIDSMLASGQISMRNLLLTLIYPIFEEVSAQGFHYYARFAERALNSKIAAATWSDAKDLIATAEETKSMMQRMTPHLSSAEFRMRFLLAVHWLNGTLAFIDRNIVARMTDARTMTDPGITAENILSMTVDLVAASFQLERSDEGILDSLSRVRSPSAPSRAASTSAKARSRPSAAKSHRRPRRKD